MAIGLVVLLYGGLFGWLATTGPDEDTATEMAERTPMGQAVILGEKDAPPTKDSGSETTDQTGTQDTPPDNTATAAEKGPSEKDPGDTGEQPDQQATTDPGQSQPQQTARTEEERIRQYLKKPAYSAEVDALSSDPVPGMMESTAEGVLPMVSSDGRKPWRVYARPYDPHDPRPRIAIVLTGMGLNSAATTKAIKDLPGEISLAVSPYADNVENWVKRARSRGHEVLIHIPMEPDTYPVDDPGPHTLLTGVEAETNIERLHWAMSRAVGYAGLVNFMGRRFTENHEALQPVLAEMEKRGVYFLDNNTADDSQVATVAARVGLPISINSVVLDDIPTPERIDEMLAETTRIARRDGVVVAMSHAYPVTLERLQEWIKTLQPRGYVLVPVSATVAKADELTFHAPGN